jgi:hypothetical protein
MLLINLCGILLRNQSIYSSLCLVAGRDSHTLLLTSVVELCPHGNMPSEAVGPTYICYILVYPKGCLDLEGSYAIFAGTIRQELADKAQVLSRQR